MANLSAQDAARLSASLPPLTAEMTAVVTEFCTGEWLNPRVSAWAAKYDMPTFDLYLDDCFRLARECVHDGAPVLDVIGSIG